MLGVMRFYLAAFFFVCISWLSRFINDVFHHLNDSWSIVKVITWWSYLMNFIVRFCKLEKFRPLDLYFSFNRKKNSWWKIFILSLIKFFKKRLTLLGDSCIGSSRRSTSGFFCSLYLIMVTASYMFYWCCWFSDIFHLISVFLLFLIFFYRNRFFFQVVHL